MAGIIAVNGRFTAPEKACISALDRGFLFGDNVFETLVAFHGKVLNPQAHLRRLRHSAEDIGLDIPFSDEELLFEIQHACQSVADSPKLTIRLIITRGNGLGLLPSEKATPTRVILCMPSAPFPPEIYHSGLSLLKRRLPYTERGAMAKTGNYLRSIVAIDKATRQEFDDILWENSEGEITESSIANVFFIGRQGDLVDILTPPAQSGILLGITRTTVLRLLEAAKIRAREEMVYGDELARFDEAFLCSTVRGLVPIRRISEHTLHTCRPNSVFSQIHRLFLSWFEREIGDNLDWNTGLPKKI